MANYFCPSVLTVVSLLLCYIQVVLSGYERNCDYYHPPSPKGICGKRLADLVEHVCISYYGGKKRIAGEPMPMDKKDTHPWSLQRDLSLDSSIFLPKEKAFSVLGKRGGSYHGRITCECCYYQCSFRELSQYCSVAETVKRSSFGLSNIFNHKSAPVKESENDDILHKQVIGRMLRSYGSHWLENYFMYLDTHGRMQAQSASDHGEDRDYFSQD